MSKFMRRSDKKLLTEALNLLSPVEKTCVLLHTLGNLSYQQIAEMSKTSGTIWPRSKTAVFRIIATVKRKARGV